MIQVWIYDENNFYAGKNCFVEEAQENMTAIPLTIGYIKPYFNKYTQEWSEGATQDEIDKWYEDNKVDTPPTPSLDDEIKVLKEQNKVLNDAISELSMIVAMGSV